MCREIQAGFSVKYGILLHFKVDVTALSLFSLSCVRFAVDNWSIRKYPPPSNFGRRAAGISMVVPAPRRRAEVWDTTPEEAALVEEVSAPARGITSLAWLRPFASLLKLDLRHNRLCCLDGI